MTNSSIGQAPPDSFRLAVAGYALLATGIPMCLGMAIASWSRWGLNAFVTGLFVAITSCILMTLVLGLGVTERRRWWRRWMRGAGTALLVGWVITLLIALAFPLGLISLSPGANPRLGSIDWTGLVILLALSLPAYWLLRTLRDPYWRAGEL